MTSLDHDQRRLLVIAGLAAVNHRLAPELERILPVLPELISDRRDLLFCTALMMTCTARVDEIHPVLEELELLDKNAVSALREIPWPGASSTPAANPINCPARPYHV